MLRKPNMLDRPSATAEEIKNLRKETLAMKELRESLGTDGFGKRVVEKARGTGKAKHEDLCRTD